MIMIQTKGQNLSHPITLRAILIVKKAGQQFLKIKITIRKIVLKTDYLTLTTLQIGLKKTIQVSG